ncbi:MAG: ABC transporter ATP-binding protein [bacterium]|nr:ABC transporter ATP-binding protein [bacterium]
MGDRQISNIQPSNRGDTRSGGTSSTLISFENVSKTFPDGTHAVDNVSLTVEPGQFVTVVGPSGCGKSTLLRMGSGLLPVSSGEVRRSEGNLGYVFQDATLLPWRTVQKNVELFCELRGFDRSERRKRAKDAIDLVGLSGFNRHFPAALSGGMKMRVSLARSLTLDPPLFFFDEPFGALDEITREYLNLELLRIFAHAGFGAVFITHNLYEAVFLSTDVLVMSSRPGRILKSFSIPFPYPRDLDLRFDPAFAELTGEVSEVLRDE